MANNNQNDQNTTPLGNTHNVVNDLQGASYANLRKAIADGYVDGIARAGFDPKNKSQSVFQDRRNELQMQRNSRVRNSSDYKRTGNMLDDFEEGIKDGLLDALAGGDFKKNVQDALHEFTKEFGFELKDIAHEVGKEYGRRLGESDLGQYFKKQAGKLGDKLLDAVFNVNNIDQKAAKDKLSKVFDTLINGASGSGSNVSRQAASSSSSSSASTAASSAVGSAVGSAAGSSSSSGSSLAMLGASKASSSQMGYLDANSGLMTYTDSEMAVLNASKSSTFVNAEGYAVEGNATSGLASSGASAAAVGAALLIFIVAMKPVLEGLVKYVSSLLSAFTKEEDMRKKRRENAQKRLEADMEWMVREPFEILTNAAKAWEEAWDSNLSKVALTQGYTKEDVYDLYEMLAISLRQEGLDSAIAATDIIQNLSSILDAGLSGTIAQAFAYESTKLNAAIPTQNFVGYASTYAQLASEAVAMGYSQGDAINYANQQLELFASNLLYSSRTLTGGFTTGLQNAETLFKDAVDIAQAAKTSNAAEISGTLTAVSGIIGAVAPDLAQGLVQNIVDAAVGGNSDTIVALRSLAGVNASNTQFLQLLAEDPKGLFVNIFRSLGELQSMSPDNYMEVAEGLASVFGVEMKALARVDFASLSAQISEMEVNTSSLQENIDLLKSGQATMSTEQLKLQEINEMILDEGLAYVIDSEAGRTMQQHMWDEQMNNALMENEYAVNLQGAALELLEGLRHTVANILSFLNPIGYIANGIEKMVATWQDSQYNTIELAQILQLGAVGGNQTALNNLLNYNGVDLGVTNSLVEMMGGKDFKGNGFNIGKYGDYIGIALGGTITQLVAGGSALAGHPVYSAASWNSGIDSIGGAAALDNGALLARQIGPLFEENHGGLGITSLYSGFTVGKNALSTKGSSGRKAAVDFFTNTIASATEAASSAVTAKWQEFLDSAEAASDEMSYEKWEATAKQYGLDLSDLSDIGMTREQLKGYYESFQAGKAGKAEAERKADEQQFWEDGRQFFTDARLALANIQNSVDEISEKIGDNSEYTVISVLGLIYTDVQSTFVKSSSSFQKCLSDWIRYMADVKTYQSGLSSAQAWGDLVQAEGQAQQETLLALANAMQVFSADELKKMDPQLQANVLLGQIVVILQTMMQQNSTVAGGISLPETLSALGFGMTFKTNT